MWACVLGNRREAVPNMQEMIVKQLLAAGAGDRGGPQNWWQKRGLPSSGRGSTAIQVGTGRHRATHACARGAWHVF